MTNATFSDCEELEWPVTGVNELDKGDRDELEEEGVNGKEEDDIYRQRGDSAEFRSTQR